MMTREELEYQERVIVVEERLLGISERKLALKDAEFMHKERDAIIKTQSHSWPNSLRTVGDVYMVEDLAESFNKHVYEIARSIFVRDGMVGFRSSFYISEFNTSEKWKDRMMYEVESDGEGVKVRSYATPEGCEDKLYSQWITAKYVQEQGWTENPQWIVNFEQMAKYAAARMFIKAYAAEILQGGYFAEDLEAIKLQDKIKDSISESVNTIASDMRKMTGPKAKKQEDEEEDIDEENVEKHDTVESFYMGLSDQNIVEIDV